MIIFAQIGLDNTFEVLENFKKSHRRNITIHKQFSALENIISNMEDSPPKPIGKESRIVNPIFRDENCYH